MTRNLTTGSPMRLILQFAVPTLLGLLFQQCYNLVDTMIVGKLLGAQALAAVGSTGSINFGVIGFCTGVCSGFAIPVAQQMGAGAFSQMRRYVANAAYLSALFALVLTVATGLGCQDILTLMRTPSDIFAQANSYIFVIFMGIPVTFLYNLLAGILRSLGDSRTPVYFLALSSFLNIFLDFALILWFNTGVAGAAIATVVAQGISGLACLAYMSDFGTAAIFFVTFLVIAYLRSGDWATLALICGGGVFAVLTMLSLKPYILQRFATWGHAWQNASVGSGYQQTRTMSAAASGGLVGVGPGEGWLHTVGAGDTDLVFGMLCEEWGLIIALLAVLSILTLAVFAVRACRAGRSSFYVIAACAATSMMVFQTCLNVFGAVDILPLTGVTFPFVSNGGTAMIASWGLLAFLKATDTRQNASFAIRLPSRREDRRGAALAPNSAHAWDAYDEED